MDSGNNNPHFELLQIYFASKNLITFCEKMKDWHDIPTETSTQIWQILERAFEGLFIKVDSLPNMGELVAEIEIK